MSKASSRSSSPAHPTQEKDLSRLPEADGLVKTGQERLSRQEYNGALTCFDVALKHNPNHLGAWCGKGEVSHQLGDIKEATRYFKRVLQSSQATTEALWAQGMIHYYAGNHIEAVKWLGQVELTPTRQIQVRTNGVALCERASADKEPSLTYRNALNYFNLLTDNEIRSVEILHWKAKVLYYLGNYGEALHLINEALQKEEVSSYLWEFKGDLHTLLNETPEAIQAYTHAISCNPHLLPIRKKKGQALLRQEDFGAALRCFDSGLILDPTSVGLLCGKGDVYRLQGYNLQAMQCYEEALQHDPEYYQALYGKATIYKTWDAFESAYAIFEQMVKLSQKIYLTDPLHIYTLYSLGGDLSQKLGMPQEAVQYYNIALNYHQAAETYYGEGRAYMAMQQYNQAIRAFEKVLTIAPHHEQARRHLVGALHCNGQEAQAKALEESIKAQRTQSDLLCENAELSVLTVKLKAELEGYKNAANKQPRSPRSSCTATPFQRPFIPPLPLAKVQITSPRGRSPLTHETEVQSSIPRYSSLPCCWAGQQNPDPTPHCSTDPSSQRDSEPPAKEQKEHHTWQQKVGGALSSVASHIIPPIGKARSLPSSPRRGGVSSVSTLPSIREISPEGILRARSGDLSFNESR